MKIYLRLGGSVYASIPTETIHSILKPFLMGKALNKNIISEEVAASIVFDNENISVLICSKKEDITINITEEVRQISNSPEAYSIYILIVDTIKRMADKE